MLAEGAPDEAAIPAPPDAAADAPARGQLFWVLILAVIVADQVAKTLIRAHVALYDSMTIIPGVLDFVHVRNAGVAFGIFNDARLPFKAVATLSLASCALVGIGLYAKQLRPEERLARLGLSLVLGGAAGNLIDRLTAGYVLDFVDVYWRNWHFWAFNVADSAITIGAILVFAELLLVTRHASRPV